MDIDTFNQIKSGKIDSTQALDLLEKSREFVFHGSPFEIEIFTPRQAWNLNLETGEKVPDGGPAVFASDLCYPAVFRAIINGFNDPAFGFISGWDIKDGRVVYYTTQNTLDLIKGGNLTGYVYVFSKNNFKHRKGFEYICGHEVKPVLVVTVGVGDLPENIEIVDPVIRGH